MTKITILITIITRRFTTGIFVFCACRKHADKGKILKPKPKTKLYKMVIRQLEIKFYEKRFIGR